jgi:hypothetical protein
MKKLWGLAAWVVLAGCFPAWAAGVSGDVAVFEGLGVGPASPNDCVTAAAGYHQVNPWVLRAIIKVESNFNPQAVNKNGNGSVDVGIAQINSTHFNELSRFGVAPRDLMDGCVSSYVAAWHLKKQLVKYGNTWFAIGAYHSATPCYNRRYGSLVWNALVDWRVVTGTKKTVPSMQSCKGSAVASKGASRNADSVLALDLE